MKAGQTFGHSAINGKLKIEIRSRFLSFGSEGDFVDLE